MAEFSQGGADGDDELADLELVGIAEFDGLVGQAVNFQNRDIVCGIAVNFGNVMFDIIFGNDFIRGGGIGNHMLVGNHQAVADNEAGTDVLFDLLTPSRLAKFKHSEWIQEKWL